MFSFGIEPSTTSTNGASSSPRAAWRNGARNSSPPSVGESTLLWRCTFGMPGIAPRSTSSMPGWPAAVTETESPSQLIPSEIHRMWTSSTAGALGSVATAHPSISDQRFLFDLQGVDEQLLAPEHLHVEPAARLALQRELRQRAVDPARPAPAAGRHDLHRQLGALELGALGHEGEAELERGRDHLPQVADLQPALRHFAPGGMSARDADHGVGDRDLVHQQILGKGSPTSWSITRRPPNAVSTSTMPGGSVRTSPISAACSQPGTARSAASAASAWSGATNATSLPSLATYMGSMPRIPAAPATAASTGTAPSRTSIATPDARASSLSTDATPPRVASRRQCTADPADSSNASTTGHRDRVADAIGASSSNSPRASMIAVPWSPTGPDSRIRSPGARPAGGSGARSSRRPKPGGRQRRPVVQATKARGADVHVVGVSALDDLRVSGDHLDARLAGGPGDRF